MKLALTLPYAEGALTREQMLDVVRAADRLGYDSLWVAEAWSYDAFMVLMSLIPTTENIKLATGIVNVYSRTPSLIAQSAATLDAFSGGRAISDSVRPARRSSRAGTVWTTTSRCSGPVRLSTSFG